MRSVFLMVLAVFFTFFMFGPAWGKAPVSDATQECLDCHGSFHPGIAADWAGSRHAATTPKAAMQAKGLALKVSSPKVPDALLDTSVGCAECHMLRGDKHADTFEHNGYDIHVVVSPDDCAVCHVTERAQYAENIMAAAHGNLADNPLYNDLERTILGKSRYEGGKLHFDTADAGTKAEGCYYCHGTKLKLSGTETRETDAGELTFPVIEGWPNQGVGRINLDGSKGACTSCHTRHAFSMATARKPYTCKECHSGPDVPAFKVYSASKHGNLFSSTRDQWDFKPTPWTVGKDFTAPTCATCHMSLMVDSDGVQVSQRTHKMNDRLGWRIFGLIYAHRQPKSPDTTIIRNKAGLTLPTNLDGTQAEAFLIDGKQAAQRRDTMKRTCLTCHSTSWVTAHFARLDDTIAASNARVRTATQLMETIWQKGYVQGAANGGSLFDDYIERRWCDAWLLHANSVRFVSAMAGGGDYGVFENGRYQLSRAIMEIHDWHDTRDRISGSR